MIPLECAGMLGAAGMGDQVGTVFDLVSKVFDPLGLHFRIKTSLQTLVVGRDSGRACIFVALERLNTTQ